MLVQDIFAVLAVLSSMAVAAPVDIEKRDDLYAPLDYVYADARLDISAEKREEKGEEKREDLYAPLDYVYADARLDITAEKREEKSEKKREDLYAPLDYVYADVRLDITAE